MAHIIPDGWRELAATGAAQREIETLTLLAEALPDDYTVYHAVHWTNLERGYSVFGEIDFIVMNRAGNLLVIEQKSGFLDETPEGLVKRYPGRSKSVVAQLARNVDALHTKLNARPNAPFARFDYLFYCPDYQVKQPHTAGLAPERIVDASRRDELPTIIQSVLPPGEAGPEAQKVHRFLCDVIQLETDVSALIGRARNMVSRISGGLAHWARQLEFSPYRLRVTGTAGSGKTQLALAEYRATLERGGRPLYLCYNRPLADHFRAIAPEGGLACTFHAFCQQRLRAAGQAPDFSQPGAFDKLIEDAAKLPVDEAYRFDTVIVDEGQDFNEDWRELVFRHAGREARLLWLEDPMQNLYARSPVELPGWVGIRSFANFRCPRSVVRMLQSILPADVLADMPIEAASPLDAGEVEILTYADDASLLQAIKEGIRLCYSAGFRKEDVAVVTYSGRNNSRLLTYDRIGPHTMRRFTGGYDLLGSPVFSEGDVLIESVYRFKGQAAPAIVFAEVDFEKLDDQAVRKLFVGATRAMMKLVLVISERAAAEILAREKNRV
jgi:hypothetical protein